ncbi:MAG TPA: O-antigen ligase family protein [Blastocatellia bacterium]|jgi:O-antigen ligase|nr:O-antigen ligase family protein [Blastocatellia bacterium]
MIAIGLCGALVFTALAFGTVEAWSVALFESIVVALVALWLVKVVVDGRFSIRVPGVALPLAGLVLVGLAQSVVIAGNDGVARGLSMDAEATRSAVSLLVFLLVSLLLASNFFKSHRRLVMLANFLVFYGLALAAFSLVQSFSWDGRFYWIRPNTQSASPFGPFVHHGHFAGYMEMLATIPVALLFSDGVRKESRLIYGVAASVMGLSILAAWSRGGMISLAASMAFILVMNRILAGSNERPRRRLGRPRISPALRSALFVAALALAAGFGAFWMGLDQVRDDAAGAGSGNGSFYASRGWIWSDTLSMIRANPIAGVGLGAFETAYPIYSRSDGSLIVGQAHNDYLQIVADCGVFGAVLALWFIALLARGVYRGIRSRDPFLSGLALGSGAGLFALLVHSTVDFNLQLPANSLLFLFLAAVVARVEALVIERETRPAGEAGERLARVAIGV